MNKQQQIVKNYLSYVKQKYAVFNDVYHVLLIRLLEIILIFWSTFING